MAETANGLSPNITSYAAPETNRLLATAGNSPQSASQWLGVAQGQVQLSTQEFNLANGRITALNNIAASGMADPSLNNLTGRIGEAVKAGLLPAEMGAQALNTISPMTDDQRRQWAFQHSQQLADYSQKLHAAYGQTGTFDNGQVVTPIRTVEGPNAGVYRAGGSALQEYMRPDQANAPHTYTDPKTGRTINTTIRGYGQDVGDTAGLPPTMGADAPAAAPPAGYSGIDNPSSYVDPRRAATAGVTIVNGRPVYGGMGTPPPPGTQPGDVVSPGPVGGRAGTSSRGPTVAGAGLSQPQPQIGGAPQPTVPGLAGPSLMLGAGLKAYQDDQANASAKMDGVRQLQQALPLVQALGPTGSGPTSAAFNKAKSTLTTLGVLSPDTTDVAAYDEAKKYLSNYVSKSALAGRSDMGQLQAQASSPNLDQSNAATLTLAQNAIAADRMDAARPKAFEATGNDNLAGYGGFKAGYTQSQDLRAYKLDLMAPTAARSLMQSMSTQQKQADGSMRWVPKNTPEASKFWASVANAHAAGVLNQGGAGGQ